MLVKKIQSLEVKHKEANVKGVPLNNFYADMVQKHLHEYSILLYHLNIAAPS